MVLKKEEKTTCCLGSSKRCGEFMSLSMFVLFILAIFLIAQTYGTLKENLFIGQDIVARNTINVSGEGEVSATPDIASFSFSVKEEAKTVEQAQKKATEKTNAVLGFLNKEGINESDIKTTGYNIYPRYEWWTKEIQCFAEPCISPERERQLVAYEVSQNITVKLDDIAEAGKILAGIGSLEVSNVSGLSFDIEEKEELQREARQIAIEEAKSKAKQLAKDLGVKLVRIVSYSSSEGNNYSRFEVMEASMAFGKGGDMAIPEIPTGENEIKTTVYITYEIK